MRYKTILFRNYYKREFVRVVPEGFDYSIKLSPDVSYFKNAAIYSITENEPTKIFIPARKIVTDCSIYEKYL